MQDPCAEVWIDSYAGDYGYHTGNLIWRGHFTSTGAETGIDLNLFGGTAFAYSAWLNSTFLGSWVGDALHWDFTGQFKFPTPLTAGQTAVLTILSDTSGYDGDWWPAVSGAAPSSAPSKVRSE